MKNSSLPSDIGSVKTRNRLIKSAAGLQYWAQGDNPVTDKAKYLYEAFARGGVGLIIMESPGIEKGGRSYRLDNDKHIQAMSEVTKVIHKHGCPRLRPVCRSGQLEAHTHRRYPARSFIGLRHIGDGQPQFHATAAHHRRD